MAVLLKNKSKRKQENATPNVQATLDDLSNQYAADAYQTIARDGQLNGYADDVEVQVVVSLVRPGDNDPNANNRNGMPSLANPNVDPSILQLDAQTVAKIKRREQDVIIQAHDVVKTYDTGKVRVEALRGVNLNIPRGEMVAIMGPSGCGKTTLLNTLSGLDDITSGDIIIETESLRGMSDRKRTRYRAERMGFIFQAYNLLPVLSAVENVELPLLVAGISPRQARPRAIEMLELVGLGNHLNQRPAELSGGQQQRVTIARALVNKPAIVWGDELTGALDSETSGEIMSLVRQLNDETGQTFVIVTHDPGVAHQAHRIIRMRDGLVESEQRLR